MPQFDIYITSLAFVFGVYVLITYNQDASFQGWLAPFNVGGALSALVLTAFADKGSLSTFGIGFLLLGVLILNTLVMYFASLLPGQMVTFKSPASKRLGGLLVRVLGIGLFTLVRNLITLLVQWIGSLAIPNRRYVAQLQGI
jgi:hypothetical protein